MSNPQYSYIRFPVKFRKRTLWINNCNIVDYLLLNWEAERIKHFPRA